MGPVRAVESHVEFPIFSNIEPYSLLQNQNLSIFPGDTLTINLAIPAQNLQINAPPELTVKIMPSRDARCTLAIGVRPVASIGQTLSCKLIAKSGMLSGLLNVIVSPVRTNAYGARAQTLANADGRELTLTSGKPFELGWRGVGAIDKRLIGSRGYVLFRADGTPALRKVDAPFVDTFAKLGAGFSTDGLGISSVNFVLDGRPLQPQGWKVPGKGATGTVDLQTSDNLEHIVTLITSERFENGAPSTAFTITDKVTKKNLPLAQLEGPLKIGIVQFTFRGGILLNIKQLGKGTVDVYDCSNIVAIFFD